ncbi:MAG: methyltransferase [Bacteroidales bacterium]|jgi:tRNA1Val (adenine37-N6)-methyltransferase|nr:methyltransferase [Bacteroidales bacterium]
MANNYFSFKYFTVYQDQCAFKVGTDGVLLGAAADVSGAKQILDIGTGTGLIALMMAQRSNAGITAIEPDHDSFIQACSNVNNSKWAPRIRVVNESLQEFDPHEIKFDLIVSNPPFFSDSLRNPDMAKASARHNDTLRNKDLLEGAARLMAEGGRLQVIMPYVEGNILIAEAQEYGLYCNSMLKIKPLPTSEIRRLILTFSKQRQKATERFLTIEHGRRHEFTEEYKNLTKDFYLKF